MTAQVLERTHTPSSTGDFYAIDPMLFSPAKVIVTAIETGKSFRAGELNFDLLDASFS